MPYAIKKSGKGFKVYNTQTGKVYSKQPLTLQAAKNQLTILNLHGAGFFDYLKNVFSTKNSGPVDKLVKDYGNYVIQSFDIYRTPVESKVQKLLNVVSFGKYKKELEKSPYDELFHLNICFKCTLNDKTIFFMTEKAPAIKVKMWGGFASEPYEKIHVDLENPTITIAKMFEITKNNMGNNFNTYEAVKNNCQVYVLNLLHALGVHEYDDWVLQDAEKIVTGHTRKVSKLVTDLGHLTARLTGGNVFVVEKPDGFHVMDYSMTRKFNRHPLELEDAKILKKALDIYYGA